MTNVRFNQPAFRTFDSFFENLFTEAPLTQKTNNRFYPAVNISENDGAYELELNVPGRNKEDFKITFDNSILTIAFEKKEENQEESKDEKKKFIKKEFSAQSFKRSFTLDEKINAEAISAKYENGILALTLPKVEEVKVLPKEISIK